MKRTMILAALAIASLQAETSQPVNAPGVLTVDSKKVNGNEVEAWANIDADYVDAIKFTAYFTDGSFQVETANRNRLQRDPSSVKFKYDPAKTQPIGVIAAALCTTHTGQANVR